MAQRLIQILVTWTMFDRSLLVSDLNAKLESHSISCDTYFCSGILIKPELAMNCSHLIMDDSDKCVCNGELNTEPGAVNSCDYFVKKLPVDVYFEWNTDATRRKLSIEVPAVHETFYSYMDKFLRYLSLTNITDFEFTGTTNGPGLNYFELICDGDLLTSIFNLSENYTANRVEKFTLTNSCIREITRMFSSVFPDLLELTINDNFLHVFNSSTLLGLSKIVKLDLHKNRLTDFENGLVFQGLSSVRYLDLSVNRLTSLKAGLLDPLENIEVLNMSNNKFVSLHHGIFRQNTELRVLELSECLMNNTIQKGTFKDLQKLEFISLSSNMFSELPFDAFHSNVSLKYLKLSSNYLTNFSSLGKLFSNLITLEMSFNCLDNSSLSLPTTKIIQNLKCDHCCLDNWKLGQLAQWVTSTIDFRYNDVGTLDMNILRNVSHLKEVYLGSYMTLEVKINLSYPLYTNSSLGQPNTQLFLSDYIFEICEYVTLMLVSLNKTQHPDIRMVRSDVSFIITDFEIADRSYENKEEVFNDQKMSNTICNFTFYCPDKCECTTKGFNEIITVNCSGKELTAFPNIDAFHTPIILDLSNNDIHHIESPLSHTWTILRELNLNNNSLESVNDFGNSRSLQTLDLRNNRLKQFPSLSQLSLPVGHRLRLLLSHNPWQCDCDIQENVKSVMHASDFIDSDELWCNSVDTGRRLYLRNSTDTELCPIRALHQLLLKSLVPLLVFLIVTFMAAVIVYYRHKEFIKFWLFSHGFCLRFVTEDDIDEDKIYDAFVSYSSLDEDWVSCNLVPGLENELPSYKLCLHDRDWPAGEWIIEQIFASVKQSRRTIIVLTDNFVESVWSQMEFMAAYKQSITDQVNRVLVVVPGQIPEESKLSPELKSFVTLNTYIQYENPYFWRKLRSAMPRVKQPCAKPHNHEEIGTASSSV